MTQPTTTPSEVLRAAGRATIAQEAAALADLAAALDGPLGDSFVQAAELCLAARGRIIITGMGKSGHIGRKIAATLASTGSPAHFVHPAEASHGDLGMITTEDCVLAISRNGESRELNDIIFHCRRLHVRLIGMTMRPASTLATASDVALVLPDSGEALEDTPAPTTSTTMCLAMGDALAIALLQARGFSVRDFSALHPGGKLGAMLQHVSDVMRTRERVPLIDPAATIADMVGVITEKGIGCIGVVDNGALIGVVTDGDLRRRFAQGVSGARVRDVMSTNPKTIRADAPLADAMALMSDTKITALFVVDHENPVGVIHMHDLLTAGVR
jgi:arabinose-5-phosphate isomerase